MSAFASVAKDLINASTSWPRVSRSRSGGLKHCKQTRDASATVKRKDVDLSFAERSKYERMCGDWVDWMMTTRQAFARVTKTLLGRPQRFKRVGTNTGSRVSKEVVSSVAAAPRRSMAAPDRRDRSEAIDLLRGADRVRKVCTKYSGATLPHCWSTSRNTTKAFAILSHVSSVSFKDRASLTERSLYSASEGSDVYVI